MQINPDGTKTMETGSEKMIYQWNGDLNVITKQTKESITFRCIKSIC
jgi:hypothetical protein